MSNEPHANIMQLIQRIRSDAASILKTGASLRDEIEFTHLPEIAPENTQAPALNTSAQLERMDHQITETLQHRHRLATRLAETSELGHKHADYLIKLDNRIDRLERRMAT